MTCAQLRKKTRTSISRKICCVKSGFQILYAVEQFSLLFSKARGKGHTSTKTMIRVPRACRAMRFSANSSHMCCGELALEGLALAGKGFPRSLTDGYAMLMSPSSQPTAPTCVVWSLRLIDFFALTSARRGFSETWVYPV